VWRCVWACVSVGEWNSAFVVLPWLERAHKREERRDKMGKVIRPQRKGKGSVFKAHTHLRKGPVGYKRADFAERQGYVKGVVRDIVHDSGRGAPVARIQFKDPYRFKRVNSLVAAPEGLHSGQFIYAGRKG
jgi:large subunit ribosomal protein L8e